MWYSCPVSSLRKEARHKSCRGGSACSECGPGGVMTLPMSWKLTDCQLRKFGIIILVVIQRIAALSLPRHRPESQCPDSCHERVTVKQLEVCVSHVMKLCARHCEYTREPEQDKQVTFCWSVHSLSRKTTQKANLWFKKKERKKQLLCEPEIKAKMVRYETLNG